VRALAYIAKTQDEQGGWRYYAEPQLRQSDTSVTGWMMMAPAERTIGWAGSAGDDLEGIGEWLELSRRSAARGLVSLQPVCSRLRWDRSLCRTATDSLDDFGGLADAALSRLGSALISE
jgi:hypothetical protein